MPRKGKRIDKTLRMKGLDPSMSFIVVKPITYVPSGDLKTLEILQFVSSIFTLIGGVFLGIVTTPNPNHPYFLIHLAVGITLVALGIGVFYLGVHRQIKRWEREKKPMSLVS